VPTLVLTTLREQSSQSRQGSKQKIFMKPSQSLAPKGITYQKLLNLIKAILTKESSLEGISNQSTSSRQTPRIAHLKCNAPLQKKGNLKLHALTSMQTKNQNEKHETTLPYA